MRRGETSGTASCNRGIATCVAVLGLVVVLSGCSRPTGWERLWSAEWQQVQVGERWDRGVPADGRRFEARRGDRFRATLVNTGEQPEVLTLLGEGVELVWTVPALAVVSVDEELSRTGAYTAAAPPSVWLGSPRVGLPVKDPRLIAFVLVDTLRDDHVNRELMPGVLASFAKGRRWTDVSANAPWTLPSVGSLFTSRPALDVTTPGGEVIGIPQGMETWAEALDRAGFAGGGFVANFTVHALNGFGAGFDTFMVPNDYSRGFHPDARVPTAAAEAWLAQRSGEHVFIYLHLMDPHDPYRDHQGAFEDIPDIEPLGRRERTATADEIETLRRLYAGEVRHVDTVLTPFLQALPPTAVVALTSDHGESLGEHGSWRHGFTVYRTELSVPLLLSGPGVQAGVSREPVQLLDLAPTLLALAGCPPAEGMVGKSLLDGGSQVPTVAATFGAGPLRWSWRRGNDKLILHTAPQPGVSVEARATVAEKRPLPTGLFRFDLLESPDEEAPGTLDAATLARFADAFAESMGVLVPGLQIVTFGGPGPVTLGVGVGSEFEPLLAFSVAAIDYRQASGLVEVTCRQAHPVCWVAGALDPSAWVQPVADSFSWEGVSPSERTNATELMTPTSFVPGPGLLWWTPDREMVVDAYEETVKRLRALGYLE